MTNPFGGQWNTLTSSEYYKMDDANKRHYHGAMLSFYNRQIKRAVTPKKEGQAPSATDDEIRGLRELFRFHNRQLKRIWDNSPKDNYYSLDEETNRVMIKPQYDAVERIPHTTKEMYDKYSRKQKLQYWSRLATNLRRRYGQTDATRFARKMRWRMIDSPNYTPPFEGDNLTKEEYINAYHISPFPIYPTPETEKEAKENENN